MASFAHRFVFITALGSAGIGGIACSANIHDNTVSVDATVDFKADATVNVDDVKPGSAVPVTMNATGVVLVDPKTTPPAADTATAAYFKIYLDDVDSDPLVVTAQTSVSVSIPQTTPPGKHHLICRLNKHDGTPTDQEQSIDINVTASATVIVGAKDAG